MSGIVVFLGPSLSLEQARRRLDATYLPPVAQGDILRVLASAPTAIGIVDGLFDRVPAVWHKEILVALESRVLVAGAASMGALRAAELDGFGMRGIGSIYAQYRSGQLEDDDEVAVAHGDAEFGWRPLSEAMVNVRDHCRRAVAAGVLAPCAAAIVIDRAKRLHYPERRYPRILAEARAAGVPAAEIEPFEAWRRTSGPGLKARDTMALLAYLARPSARRRAPSPAWRLERTEFLEMLRLEVEQNRRGSPAPSGGGRSGGAARHQLGRNALLRVLAGREAIRQGIVLSDDEIQQVADEFRRRRGLRSRERTVAWLRRCGLDADGFGRLMESEALIEALARGKDAWGVAEQIAAEWALARTLPEARKPRKRQR